MRVAHAGRCFAAFSQVTRGAQVDPARGQLALSREARDALDVQTAEAALRPVPQTLLAYAWNDQPLAHNRGAPLRLYSPTKLGYKMTKWLVSITFTDKRPGGYWEDQGYPWFAGI